MSARARVLALRRLLQLSAGERRPVTAALITLWRVHHLLKSRGLVRTEVILQSASRVHPFDQPGVDVERLSRWLITLSPTVGAHCLARTLTLAHLLHDPATRVCIGVKPGEETDTPALDAHAWLERDGTVLNDDQNVRSRFAVINERASLFGRGA